jgi:mevalonate kinase
MKNVQVKAPGKTILFGEHAVVYGYPAIAMAISVNSQCKITETNHQKVIINLEDYNASYEGKTIASLASKVPSKNSQIIKCLEMFKEQYGIELQNIAISLSSKLFPSAGLGSSASIAVSLTQAINRYYGFGLSKSEINDFAYTQEKIVHGSPSGIDNNICTYGNAIYFQDGNFEFIEVPEDLTLLISYTNVEHDTKEAINRIKQLKEHEPQKTTEYLERIGEITEQARKEINKGNIQKIGRLMNRNNDYLSKLQVSNEAIDNIVNISRENGAWGSKLTGAGLGGCVITLGDRTTLNKIQSILTQEGYKSFIADNDTKGVSVIG